MTVQRAETGTLSHVVVAGGSGYIGAVLVDSLTRKGVAVTVLGRRPAEHIEAGERSAKTRHLFWSLTDPLPQQVFEPSAEWGPPDAVIYLTHDWSTESEPSADPNLIGFSTVLDAARAAGDIRFVLASSVSARQNALNRYGRIKWEMENRLKGDREVAARIGLVYGGEPSGQWASLLALSRLPVIPMPDPWKRVQPIHVEDLAQALYRLCVIQTTSQKVYGLAAPDPMSFGRFLRLVSAMAHRRRSLVVPVPSVLVLGILRVLSLIPGLPVPDRERILGLVGLKTIPTAADLDRLGCRLRLLAPGLARCDAAWRADMVREARVHLGYTGRSTPGLGTVRRYVRELRSETGNDRVAAPLSYPRLLLRWPGLLRFLDPVADKGVLPERLDLAFRISEMHGTLAGRIYDYDGDGTVRTVGRLCVTGVVELLCLPVRLVTTLALRR